MTKSWFYIIIILYAYVHSGKGDDVLKRQFVDIHSHILPGVDDGCSNEEQTIAILKEMEAVGVTDVILTPHYCKRREYVASLDFVAEVFENLKKRAIEENISVVLHLGTEMEYSQDGARYIREHRVNTLCGTNYILVEFPPYIKADTLLLWAREIISIGLVPVIAHIERYHHVVSNKDWVESLKGIGALIQVNIRSIIGYNFKIRKFMKWLITNRYVDFIGGDVHNDFIEQREIDKCSKFVIKHSDENYLDAVMSQNAKKYLLRQK